jgi:mono/diheme cytochrome c family protein
MSNSQTKTSLFLYVPVVILGIFIIYYVFSENFKQGMTAGKNAPPPDEPRRRAGELVDHRALARDTDLALAGKTLFSINCTSCHGTDGKGDGPRAAGLNPPPRNYKTEDFKFGNDIVSIYLTLMKGSAGTSMPSFALLPTEDLFAMAHYVCKLVPNVPPITDEILARLPESPTGGSGEEAAAAIILPDSANVSGARIPIQFAMQRMAQSAPQLSPGRPVNANHPGAKLFAQHCVSCHGSRGEGQVLDWISVAPYTYSGTVSLADRNADWYADRDAFVSLVTQGIPGRIMPGNGSLTTTQLDNLYSFVKGLAE